MAKTLWRPMSDSTRVELYPTRRVAGIDPEKLRFVIVGDNYLFQGDMRLDRDTRLRPRVGYNLGINSTGPTWIVQETHRSSLLLPRDIRDAGRRVAQRLAATLPEIQEFGARKTTEWFQDALRDPDIFSDDEIKQRWVRERSGKEF